MSNIYEEQKLSNTERVILAEDLKLPELTKEPLTYEWLEEHKGEEYKLAFREYTNLMGKFFLPIMTPLKEQKEVEEESKPAPSTTGHKGAGLETKKYKSSNIVEIVIPKYILLNYIDIIPKGTEFVAASVNNDVNAEELRIIGIYSIFAGEGGMNSSGSGTKATGKKSSSKTRTTTIKKKGSGAGNARTK